MKTSEHIVPQWLIQLTGDPKREAHFGPFWDRQEGKVGLLRIPFDQFQFPACAKCNQRYGHLEAMAKDVVVRMLNDDGLSQEDLQILMSWTDKIRVGLWLGIYYLHRELSDIEPRMFIESRLDLTDRAILIYKSDNAELRLNFAGTDTLAFQYMPSCFTLLINNFALFNLSTDFLISRRVGLPYPTAVWWAGWPAIQYDLEEGHQKIRHPVLQGHFNTRCTQLYQPMYSRPELLDDFSGWYDNDHVHRLSADQSAGIGKVLHATGRRVEEYPEDHSKEWIPSHVWGYYALQRLITKQTLEFQIRVLDYGPQHMGLESERAGIIKRQHQLARDHNHKLLEAMGLDD